MADSPMPNRGSQTGGELIPIRSNDGKQAVLGRDLHEFLEVTTPYDKWMPRMVAYGFEEGKDFSTFLSESTGGRPRQDHIITLDMAKEISMIQRTPKGKQARQYFIECERQAKQPRIDGNNLTRLELIQIAMNAETERLQLEAKNKELEPKADAYDTFISGDGTYSVGNVAKMLGLSQNKLFDELRNHRILIPKGAMRNTPYQQYMHHFTVKAYDYERSNGERATSYTTRVQPNGINFIARKLGIDLRKVA